MTEIHLERTTLPPSNADVDDINGLLRQLASSVPGKVCIVPRETYGARVMQTITNAYLVIARDRSQRDKNALGKIIGMACLSECLPLSHWYGFIDDVVRDEDYRGGGLGERLMQELIARAKETGLEKIELSSHPNRIPANIMYLRLGFELVVEGDAEKGTSNQYRLLLR